jgi:hypothetical protein
MQRRQFLMNSLGFAGAMMLPLRSGDARAEVASERANAIAGWRQRIRSILDRGRVPIIDIEATHVPGTDVERMIGFMDRLDVAQIAFAPANAPNGQPSIDLYHRHPERFIPTTNSGEFPRWWNNPTAFLDVVRQDLQSGRYYLMGEHEFRHYPSPEQVNAGNRNRDISIPIDGPAGQGLFRLSEETGVAFQIHYEIEDRLLPALEAMLERHPKARVIWCHLAMIRYPSNAATYNPTYIRSLIERFPGLHFDLAVPPPNSVYGPSGARDSTLYADGALAPPWRALIETHPDRFLAASDYRLPVERHYPDSIGRQRDLILAALSEPARHLVAYGNAWRLITGESWTA